MIDPISTVIVAASGAAAAVAAVTALMNVFGFRKKERSMNKKGGSVEAGPNEVITESDNNVIG